ncbi:hypothetical protein [Allosphingosinicella vermicomposti]|uniref:hypothetical protein n=1 Tax=Allosphingosinicella vermicomposti TaxID=614671 RepID=UPI00131A4C49|nr:hypothetical protein [Allosphingosinicella vermicomposti]
MKSFTIHLFALTSGLASPALAQDAASTRQAATADIFYSADADDTEVIRYSLTLDWLHDGPERRQGVRIEKALFNPIGQGQQGRERVYLQAADGERWKWNASIGTDGDTVLGSAAIHNESRFRQEYFIERDILETPRGLREGIYYTFAGASIDLPVDGRNMVNLLAGVQEFTGDNVRTHIRGNYVHTIDPDLGLSAQLRGRYFRNSDPREYDYYSPRWYAQAMPVLQIRRFSQGWRYMAEAGVGVLRDSNSGWRRSSHLRIETISPVGKNWAVKASFLCSETPTAAGLGYEYVQATFGLTRAF